MRSERQSPCKVNLLLNILGKRADGFHELETIMQPVNLCDTLSFERAGNSVTLTCSDPTLPTDDSNLVRRAVSRFQEASGIREGIRVRLEKKIPLAAGLGGGSSNAAQTLLALNELFGHPIDPDRLPALAAALGSDVPFFLQSSPALATGRGERIQPLALFPALERKVILLIHPGFGISTPWAYQHLAQFPDALHGQPGRAERLIQSLQASDLRAAGRGFYNSLEAPALNKYPVLALYQEHLREHSAQATLMSGSGSTTFAIFESAEIAANATEKFREKFGRAAWLQQVSL